MEGEGGIKGEGGSGMKDCCRREREGGERESDEGRGRDGV